MPFYDEYIRIENDMWNECARLSGEEARRYLDDPSKSVTEITFLLGFTDTSTFTRAFKRWTGRTPNEYRAGAGTAGAGTG